MSFFFSGHSIWKLYFLVEKWILIWVIAQTKSEHKLHVSASNYCTPDNAVQTSAITYKLVNVQLLTHLVVDMQLLPGVNVSWLAGMNVSSFPDVDVRYPACARQRTCVCARQATSRCMCTTAHLCMWTRLHFLPKCVLGLKILIKCCQCIRIKNWGWDGTTTLEKEACSVPCN